MFTQLIMWSPTVSAASGRATITNFQGGSTVQIDLDGVSPVVETFDILENTTIHDVTFNLEFQLPDESPGEVSMDIVGTSNQLEWTYSGVGYGDIGSQNEFTTGTTSTLLTSTGSTPVAGPSYYLPTNADVMTSNLSILFQPDNEGLWNELGELEDLIIADIDGDGLDEPVFLQTTGSLPQIGWIDYLPSSNNYSMVTWKNTCQEAKSLRHGNLNNDGKADIIAVSDTSQGKACVHFTNNVTILNNFFYLGAHAFPATTIVDLEIADITNDGYDDIIWANETTIGYAAYIQNYTVDPFSSTVVKEITVNGGITGTELTTIKSIAIGNYDGPNGNKSVAVGDDEQWVSLHSLRNDAEWESFPSGSLRCGGEHLVTTDLNGDLFEDIMGWTPMNSAQQQSCSYMKDPSTYQFYYNASSYYYPTGSSKGDFDGDGTDEMISVQYIPPIDIDGDELTIDGRIEINGPSANNTFSYLGSLTPRTHPSNVKLADLDGDGKDELIMIAGESSPGLFIDTWQMINFDCDNDGTSDVIMGGFSRDQIGNGTHPLVWVDYNSELASILDTATLSTFSRTTDSYGVQLSSVESSFETKTSGETLFSNLSILYDVTFEVENNPGLLGNISNYLNQVMTLGTGSIPIELSFTSTKQGSISITDLVVNYTLGAPMQPDTNPLTISLNANAWDSVDVTWTPVNFTQDTFIEYVVFRSETNDTNNLVQIGTITDVNLSRYLDTNVVENTTYWYAVIANFDYGYQTSLSNMLEVLVPSSYAVTGVTAIDQPNDGGSALFVTWDSVASSTVNGYEIYVSDYEFTDVSNLGSSVLLASTYTDYIVTLTSEKYDESGNELEGTGAIPDGVALWVAVVAVEASGSSNPSVTAVGPVFSMNNNPMVTSIALSIDDYNSDGDSPTDKPWINADSEFTITAILEGEGTPISGASITLEIIQADDYSNNVTYSDLITNEDGTITKDIDWGSHIHTMLNSFGGAVIISAKYDGMSGNDSIREQLPVEETLDAWVVVEGQFFVVGGNAWPVDQNGGIVLEVRLLSDNQDEQSLFDELSIKWLSTKDSNTISGGSVELDEYGQTTVEISNMAQGGQVQIWIDVETDLEDWMKVDMTALTVALSEYQGGTGSLDPDADGILGDADLCPATSFEERNQVDEDGCGPSEQSQSLAAPSLSCEDNWEIPNSPDQSTNDLQCTFTNTNSVYVSVSIMEWNTPDGMAIDVTCPTDPFALGPADGTISSATCTFYPTITQNIPKSVDTPVSSIISFNASIENAGGAGAGGYLDSIVTFEISYNLIGMTYIQTNATVDNTDTNTNLSQNSDVSGTNIDIMEYAPIAGGILLGLVLLLIISRLIRRRGDDDDDIDYDDDYGLFDDGSATDIDSLLGGARPLITGATGKDQGRSIGKQMPTIGRSVGRSGESESYQDDTYETTEEGYSVDEDGTEWWEDENGQWWYRTTEMEDWDAWNE